MHDEILLKGRDGKGQAQIRQESRGPRECFLPELQRESLLGEELCGCSLLVALYTYILMVMIMVII